MNSFRDLSVRRPLCKGADLRRPGFSLIVTISILVLLALVAVGLLTLSTITVRSASLTSAQAEARANARLALMLAIGELQKQVGADQRITANAAILDDQPDSPEVQGVNHPHWTGVWKSWAAGSQQFGNDSLSTHQTIARPNARQIGMAPSYEENRFDHFVDWLVSLPRPVPQDLQQRLDRARSFPLDAQLSPGDGATGVRLVGRNTIGTDDPAMFVGAALLDVDTDSRPNTERNGRYAWWVADESTKARVLGDQYELQETLANSDLIDQALSAGSPEASAIEGLDTLRDNPADLQRAVSRDSLDLLAADPSTVGRAFHSATPFSLGVMTDVREGGLKRDLNSLLERPINIDDDRDDWMLYRFGRDDDRVPIQDLSAFYQTYREVVQFDGRAARNRYAGRSMQVNNINFGGGFGFTRDYTNLYRMPFPVKYQFLLSYIGVPRDRNKIKAPNTDRYKLHVGVTPAVTFWNPYNVPLVLNTGAEQATQMRMFNIPFGIEWQKKSAKGPFNSPKPNSLVWLTNRLMEGSGNSADDGFGGSDRDNGITLYLGGDKNHVIFQPGEVRTFSLRQTGTRTGYEGILNSNRYRPELEADPGWDPSFFLVMPRSERDNDTKHVEKEFPGGSGSKKDGGALTFNPNDEIGITIHAASTLDMANGAAFHIFHRQSSTMYPGLDDNIDRSHMRRQYQFTSRLHSEQQKAKDNGFNKALMQQAFPEGSDRIVLDPVRGNELIGGDHRPFMLVSLTAGCEISQATAGDFRGRRFVSRPFLHSTPAQSAVFVDRSDKDSFYHHGWNWWVQDINSVLEASVQVAPNNRSGYWGGGYTPEFGSTNVVQQEIPLTPVHSIAALSHAQLSGYSLSGKILGYGAGARTSRSVTGNIGSYTDNPFANTTATGANGLFPRTSQAIGNSYAHPYLKPAAAFTEWTRHFNVTDGPKKVPFVDHSYLANKALWDEFFFSSIAPRSTKLFADQFTAKEVATRFFFEEERLPNRRFVPHADGLDEEDLAAYFPRNRASLRAADELAAYLMVEGPFNVNSTSVEAWKALFSSLRERDVPVIGTNENSNRLPRGVPIKSEPMPDGVPLGSTSVANGPGYTGSSPEPSDPDQWYCWRRLTTGEIDALAEAMVRQVKLRGPFLSLSEFVNRRLDRDNTDLALKGALQAAIDDETIDNDVAINAGFRESERRFSPEEIRELKEVQFAEAIEGPVAYGSAAYVDQADILRSFGGQLTPRGDTFLVRTYGDSIDAAGNVRARAWCEAVVQRVPEYLDPAADKAHLAYDDLDAEANKLFGRPFRIVSFRWLDSDEV